MPMYEFKTENGEIVSMYMRFEEFDRKVKNGVIKLADGRKATSYFSPHSLISTVPGNYPMVSTAAGVHPDQIQEHMEHLRKLGCGQVNHTKDGDVIFEDAAQRKKVCEALGLFDRNAGYSDPKPRNRTAKVRSFR